MEDFHKKSLIVRKFNPTQNSYVYGIHDLLLYHLKKELDAKKHQVCIKIKFCIDNF